MTTPAIRSTGVLAAGTGDITPVLGTHAAGDTIVLFVTTDTDTLTAPTGYTIRGKTFLTGQVIALMVRDTYAASGAESNPTITDPGNFCAAVALAIQDADKDKITIAGSSVQGSPLSSTTPSFASVLDDSLILMAAAWNIDNAGPLATSATNADVTGLAEAFDAGTLDGNGGGLTVYAGTKADAGSIRQTDFVLSSGANTSTLALAIAPKCAVTYAGTVTIDNAPAPNGSNVVKIVDLTQPDDEVITSVTSGTGAYTASVRYADHLYIAVYDDGTNRGASAAAVP